MAVGDVGPVPPKFHHVLDDGRGILEVGVDQHHRVSLREIESGGDGRLMTEVPQQIDDPDVIVLRRQLQGDGQGRVPTAIIDEHDFVFGSDFGHDPTDLTDEFR